MRKYIAPIVILFLMIGAVSGVGIFGYDKRSQGNSNKENG